MEFDVLPTKVLKEDKAEYIQALVDTRDSGDINVFLDYMTHLHCKHISEDIKTFETSVNQENVQKDVQKELTERQQAILSLIKEDSTITFGEMSKRIKVSSKTIQRELDQLRITGVIERIGGRTHGEWKVR